MSPIARLVEAFRRWGLRGRAPEPVPILLTQRRVYVLPTKAGLAYALTLIVMLVGAINYTLSLGHALVFLLCGLGVAAILGSFRNLAHLSILPSRCEPVFAGQDAHFGLMLHNTRHHRRYRIRLDGGEGVSVVNEIPGDDGIEAQIAVKTRRRGWLALPRVTLETIYPLGLVRAWAYAAPAMRCLVYPAPASEAPPLPEGSGQQQGRQQRPGGDDDFAGLRPHRPGDPLAHIDWKSAARLPDGTLNTKQFAGESGETLWLDWHALSAALDVEARLSILTRWALDAHAAGLHFGLRLPGKELPPGDGEAHLHLCLEALARYGEA